MLQAYLLFHDRAQALHALSLPGAGVAPAALVEHVQRQGCQAGLQGVLGRAGLEPQDHIDDRQPAGFYELHACACFGGPRLHLRLKGFELVQINPLGRDQTTVTSVGYSRLRHARDLVIHRYSPCGA
ncbi:hypothetical protein D3C79_603060 [compost metagenome]